MLHDATRMSALSTHPYHIIVLSLMRITSLICVHNTNVTHTNETHDAPVTRHMILRHVIRTSARSYESCKTAEYRLFDRALLQKRPIVLSLLYLHSTSCHRVRPPL